MDQPSTPKRRARRTPGPLRLKPAAAGLSLGVVQSNEPTEPSLKCFYGKTTEGKPRQPSRPSPTRLAQETQHS